MAVAFSVQDYYDLTRLLAEHPEWRAQLRQLVLTDELLTLPALVRELAEAQTRAEERLVGVEERLARLETAVAELVEAQKRTELQLTELAVAQKRTEQALAALTDAQKRTGDIVDQLLGRDLERKYGTSPWDRERAGAYFGKWLKPVEVISPNDLREALEARLRENEVDEVMLADVLIRGRLRQVESTPEVWLVLEVSHVIDRYDVDRAHQRATLLRQAGYHAMPVVAGERMLEECEGPVQVGQVAVFLNGSRKYWERAVEAALRAEH
ncbi:MAG: hypothetical protein HY327_06990 [Chloroflexi bacterium]|nr:hypothetical protein [Chloroflexota bacterium]